MVCRICCLLLLMLLLPLVTHATEPEWTDAEREWLAEHDQIVLGISTQFEPGVIVAEDGSVSGIMVDYIALLNEQLGDRIKLHIESDWESVTQKAIAREIDGLALSAPNPTWDQHFTYTDPYYHAYFYVFQRTDQPTMRLPNDLAGQRIGYLRGFKRLEHLLASVPDAELITFDTHSHMSDALLADQITAFVASDELEWRQQQLSERQFRLTGVLEDSRYPIVASIRNDWPLAVSIFNRALNSIPADKHASIRRRWLQGTPIPASAAPILSNEQRQWLEQQPAFRYTLWNDRAPVEYVDASNRPNGISTDYLTKVADYLGLRLEFVPTANWPEALERLRAGEIDLLPSAAPSAARSDALAFTDTYLELAVAIFAPLAAPFYGNLEALSGQRVAVIGGTVIEDRLRRDHPELQLVALPNAEAGKRALDRGEVVALVDTLLTFSHVIGRDGPPQHRVVGTTPYRINLAMAVRRELAPLAEMLNQALTAIPPAEREAIEQRWMQTPRVAQIDYRLLWLVLSVASLIIAIILFWSWRLSRTKAALASSETYYRTLVATMAEGLLVHDRNGLIALCNQSAERILGVPGEQLLGLNVFDWQWSTYDEDGHPISSENYPVMTTLRTGKPQYGFLMGIATPSNEELWLLINTQPLYIDDSSSRLKSMIVTFTDISERKRLERKLLETARVAEAANRAKSAFLANMSHEIRTPMNSVLGMMGLCLETELTATQRQYLDQAQRSARALLVLLNDILDFSKVEAGEITLEEIPFSLSNVLKDLESVVRHQAENKGLILHIERDPAIPNNLQGDPLRLGQVLINFSNNAIKFTEQGEITIGVRLERLEREQAWLAFTVRDTGIGMSEAQLAGLFQPFHQADNTITRRYGGTGLGLSICKRLVELMHGDITVSSQPGQGSTFTLRLALHLAPATWQAPAAAPPISENQLAGRRILVVEDNNLNRIIARTLLESAGAKVDEAEHGLMALELIDKHGIANWDLVLMDIHMPELDGLETTRRIRAQPEGGAIPIIGLSASAFAEDVAAATGAGMNAHHSKPIDQQQLFAELAHWLPAMTEAEPIAAMSSERPAASFTPPDAATRAAIQPIIDQLLALTQALDAEAEDYFLAHRQDIAKLLSPADCAALARQIESYRFLEASAVLKNLSHHNQNQ